MGLHQEFWASSAGVCRGAAALGEWASDHAASRSRSPTAQSDWPALGAAQKVHGAGHDVYHLTRRPVTGSSTHSKVGPPRRTSIGCSGLVAPLGTRRPPTGAASRRTDPKLTRAITFPYGATNDDESGATIGDVAARTPEESTAKEAEAVGDGAEVRDTVPKTTRSSGSTDQCHTVGLNSEQCEGHAIGARPYRFTRTHCGAQRRLAANEPPVAWS
jgi:hypothetical protein